MECGLGNMLNSIFFIFVLLLLSPHLHFHNNQFNRWTYKNNFSINYLKFEWLNESKIRTIFDCLLLLLIH